MQPGYEGLGKKAVSTRSIVKTNSAFTYKIAETEEEKSKIYDLRESIWKEKFPYLLKRAAVGHPAKDAFDDRSWLYYCRDAEDIIGSCRCSPMLDGQWEISSSLPHDVRLQYDPQTTVQMEKVYIRDGYRNKYLHEFLFYYFSNWMLKHTTYTRYFAVCNAELVRLYHRLGAKPAFRRGFLLTGRASHKYYVLDGQISDFNSIIKKTYSL
jgi:hypothetical protein